jgi:hypothetical protein
MESINGASVGSISSRNYGDTCNYHQTNSKLSVTHASDNEGFLHVSP